MALALEKFSIDNYNILILYFAKLVAVNTILFPHTLKLLRIKSTK